ncbi:MAG: SpoIIE family protein phosphatase, partial [Solobacterium sp.]|nr:SpoIIE family protein phosphatase [Solobacterium sp.]
MSNSIERHAVNVTGRFVDRIDAEIGKHRGVIVFGFYFTLILAILSIALLFVRGFDHLEAAWIFSIGGDIFCLLVCTMLYLSCLLAREREGAYLRLFTLLLTTTAMALFLDEMTWLVQCLEKYRILNLIINAFYYANGALLMYMFWRYVTYALNMDGKILRIVDSILGIILLPHLLACFATIVFPLYFTVDASGVYARGPYYLVSQIYLILCIISVVVALIVSKATRRQKLIASSFVSIPILSYIVTANVFGISVNYSCCMVAIVLIYGVLFADRSNSIAMTERDLALATRIQADMLPNVFPAFPERDEFDVFASMNPAKEVGGDFYDFFFIDNKHLGIVMADVSGKGVPAALFMMIAMTLIKNNALSGKRPAEVLQDTNNQICANNKEEMFVTAWFGILNIESGHLVAVNAGHEFPMLK